MMDELALRVLRGHADEAERARVAAWRREAPDHETRYRELERVAVLAARAAARLEPGDPPRAADVIARAEERLRLRAAARGPRPRGLTPVWVAVAAAAAVAVLSLGRPWPWSPGEAGALHAEELVTGRGESTTVRLSDGSVVRLGPESRLAVVTGASARQVTLEGRAFFAVTHDPRRPFRVITPAGTARVLGTRFELEAEVSDLRLVVVEGSVALASNDSEVEVRSGQMTEMRSGRAGPVRSAPGLAQLSSEWMGRFLVFQDTPLRTAAEEIAALYDVEVRIVDPSVGGRTLTMWSSSRPLEDVLTVACSVADVSCRIDGRTVTIAARAPATPDASEENHEEDRP